MIKPKPSTSKGVPYKQVAPGPSRLMGLAGPATGIGVRGIEVVQCVQDLNNSVPLIAGKLTVVRVYLDPATISSAGHLTAELAWSRDGGGETYLPALNAVDLDPANPVTLQDQRADLAKSLNFRLPAEALASGTLQLRLSRAYQPAGAELPLGPAHPTSVTFTDAPPLRIRVIGLRYKRDTSTISPAAVHFAYLKSFLQRAYPTASLNWSQLVVDADFAAPIDDSTVDLANAQIAALRSREVSSGVDPRTHYYGLVDDGHGISCAARRLPFRVRQPDVVASGPAGVPNGFAGDFDLSYADWYGAHELGHTFGRYHPGFPPGQQDASDNSFPYPDGFISIADEVVGLDTGDSDLNLPMMALPGRQHHDVMTYADSQWLSPYTYQAILHRLTEEDGLVPPSA